MKKYLSLFVILAFMFSVSLAKAEEETTANSDQPAFNDTLQAKREAFKANMQAKREAFKAGIDADRQAFKQTLKADREAFIKELKDRKDAFKTAKTEKREEFRGKVQKMIGERFEAAVKNLERIQTKVGALIEKLNTAGKDTASATEYLNLSKEKLAEAKIKIAEIKALIPANGDKVTAEVFEQIKLGAREARDLIKESHNNLVQVIKVIKGLNTEAEEDNNDNAESEEDNNDNAESEE